MSKARALQVALGLNGVFVWKKKKKSFKSLFHEDW
jgi:hypothetical protein